MQTLRSFLFSCALFGLFTTASAHDAGLSYVEGRLLGHQLELNGSFALGDAATLLSPAQPASVVWTPEAFTAQQPAWQALATQLWTVTADGVALTPQVTKTELWPGDGLSLHLTFRFPATTGVLTLHTAGVGVLPATHRQLTKITRLSDGAIMEKTLSAATPLMTIPLHAVVAPAETAPPGFWGFFTLGVEHIWTGYDHLLFLFGLLVVCRRFRSIVIVISCFTLAHSLTLAAATLDLVNLPSSLVEPVIAASILFVGVENLWRRGAEPRGRAALTFVFGLIHGFGFASVLRDLGVGSGGRGLALPLFSFNLGVEAGQIAVAAIVLPFVWWLRQKPWFLRRGVPVLSALVAAAGLYWLLERTLFS